MRRLVALAGPGAAGLVDALRRAFDAGDAVTVLDARLPDPARRRVLEALRPAVVIEDGVEHALEGSRPVEEGDALVVATSGTTGEPKGVVLTHDAVAASARATSARLSVDPRRDRWLACLPLSHVGGLAVVTRALVTGTALEVHGGFDPAPVADAARRGATLVSLVPTALARLGAGRAAAFRTILLGGQAPPEELAANVVATYGMTETGSGVVYGGWPLDGVEVRIGPDGEILLRGPMLLRAYRDGVDPKSDTGWFATGDAGTLEDGRLSVLGRLGDLVITGGEHVWPVQVEAILSRHPAVGEVAVAGRPDPEWGERVVAFVVPRAEAPTLGELRDLVKSELAPWAAPRELVVCSSLPRTSGGKLRRAALGVGG